MISVTRNSSTSITVRISVAWWAPLGSRNVTVDNPSGPDVTLNNGFQITN